MEPQKTIACELKKPVNLKEVGELLRRERLEAKLTQRQLADKLGVNFMAISHVENGRDRASKVLLNKMAKYFNVTFDLTFPYDEEK